MTPTGPYMTPRQGPYSPYRAYIGSLSFPLQSLQCTIWIGPITSVVGHTFRSLGKSMSCYSTNTTNSLQDPKWPKSVILGPLFGTPRFREPLGYEPITAKKGQKGTPKRVQKGSIWTPPDPVLGLP